jgi:hypothetical protein
VEGGLNVECNLRFCYALHCQRVYSRHTLRNIQFSILPFFALSEDCSVVELVRYAFRISSSDEEAARVRGTTAPARTK